MITPVSQLENLRFQRLPFAQITQLLKARLCLDSVPTLCSTAGVLPARPFGMSGDAPVTVLVMAGALASIAE